MGVGIFGFVNVVGAVLLWPHHRIPSLPAGVFGYVGLYAWLGWQAARRIKQPRARQYIRRLFWLLGLPIMCVVLPLSLLRIVSDSASRDVLLPGEALMASRTESGWSPLTIWIVSNKAVYILSEHPDPAKNRRFPFTAIRALTEEPIGEGKVRRVLHGWPQDGQEDEPTIAAGVFDRESGPSKLTDRIRAGILGAHPRDAASPWDQE
jgi:hypothetical protein